MGLYKQKLRHDENEKDIEGASLFAGAAYAYLQEIKEHHSLCARHEKTAAIHQRGQSLQVYRQFKRDEVTARYLRNATEELEGWEKSPYWQTDKNEWVALGKQIIRRMEKHTEQHPIITRGISWDGIPILIHAYKFEPDPVMKVELVLPVYQNLTPELPLKVIATALQCHEHLVPGYIAEALPMYDHHEAKFETLWEYLSRTMPKNLYATQCLPSSVESSVDMPTEGVLPRR